MLGAVLLDPAGKRHVLGLVEPGDMYRPWHGQVLTAMRRVGADGRLPGPVEVYGELRNDPDLPQSVARDAVPLADLMAAAPRADHASAYAVLVIEGSIRRRLHLAGSRLEQAAEFGDLAAALRQSARAGHEVGACRARWLALPERLRAELAFPPDGRPGPRGEAGHEASVWHQTRSLGAGEGVVGAGALRPGRARGAVRGSAGYGGGGQAGGPGHCFMGGGAARAARGPGRARWWRRAVRGGQRPRGPPARRARPGWAGGPGHPGRCRRCDAVTARADRVRRCQVACRARRAHVFRRGAGGPAWRAGGCSPPPRAGRCEPGRLDRAACLDAARWAREVRAFLPGGGP